MKLYSSILLIAAGLFDFAAAQSLPQVDLGYEIHQAYYYNSGRDTYNFSNIRYAQPPVGDLRFAAPLAPTGRNPEVQNGSVGRICPQAGPIWFLVAEQFATYKALGLESQFNYTQAVLNAQAELGTVASAPPDPRTTEDCLFLDVVVPKSIFDNANNMRRKRNHGGAPVIVWIYGGGYTEGSKDSYPPGGLINASQADGSQGVVFVAMNYRLGAFGWLSGPSLQAAGGVSNAGLYDQRLAIEWVAKYIHLFGGNPQDITIIGESAGGGSVMHQITAFGGYQPVSFQKAIPQSPGWVPITSQFVQENITNSFLTLLNVSTIAEARNLPSEIVIQANVLQIAYSPYGQFTYGPVVDGNFVPALPGIALLNGAYAKNVSLLIGHNRDEGALFTPPYVQTNDDLAAYLRLATPNIEPSVVDYIINVLYPPIYDGTYPYTTGVDRTSVIISELIFTCNTNYLARAYKNQTYNYEFQVPPAFHGQDIAYTFYSGLPTNTTGFFPGVAKILQGYITNFAKYGNPNGPGLPTFPMQGMNISMNGLNVTGTMSEPDDTANARCLFWQKALYT